MMVNLEEIRILFIVATLGLALVVASPVLSLLLPETNSQRFSELWLLGPAHVAESYPYDVAMGESYGVFVGVDNHMGDSEYYRIYVKFGNDTKLFPNNDEGIASSLSPLYEFRFFVDNGGFWESAVTFWFEDVVMEEEGLVVGNITINGISFPVDISSLLDSEKNGYFFELFFELWRYDMTSQDFIFHNRFVGISLNMTGS